MVSTITQKQIRRHKLPGVCTMLIDISDIISAKEIDIINDIYNIGQLENLKFTNIDVKRIFYFHIFKGVCECIDTSTYTGDHVLYYSSCDLKFLELTNYIENFKLKQFLDTLTKHVGNVLPVKFYTTSICFDNFIKSTSSGEMREHINNIRGLISKRNKNISTERTRKYLTVQGFSYLNEKYFAKYKQMMFFHK